MAIWALEAMQKVPLPTDIPDIPLGVHVEEVEVAKEHWTQAPNSRQLLPVVKLHLNVCHWDVGCRVVFRKHTRP